MAALLAGCGGGGAPSARHAPLAACITSSGYGGLGAEVNDFAANNNGSTGAAEPTPGAAWYQVTATKRGCITAYSVQDSATPPMGAHQMLVLVGDPYLPRDAKQVATTNGCAVWRSPTLKRAVGLPYARATAVAQDWTVPGRAQIEATSDSVC